MNIKNSEEGRTAKNAFGNMFTPNWIASFLLSVH
jgi:hypothetical protein